MTMTMTMTMSCWYSSAAAHRLTRSTCAKRARRADQTHRCLSCESMATCERRPATRRPSVPARRAPRRASASATEIAPSCTRWPRWPAAARWHLPCRAVAHHASRRIVAAWCGTCASPAYAGESSAPTRRCWCQRDATRASTECQSAHQRVGCSEPPWC